MKTGRRQLLMGAALTAIRPAAAQAPFGREIVVRTVTNLRSGADVERLVELARAHRIATINVAAKQDEDDEIASGLVFYNSRIAPRAPGYEGFDALGEAIRLAHRHGMKVRAWLPQFHDQVAVRANPEWQMKAYLGGRVKPYVGRGRPEYFANPGHPLAAAYQRALVEEIVAGYDVDGIVLDWLRFDDFNMDVGDVSRRDFRGATGVDPLAIDFSSDNPLRRQWNAWRGGLIADHVRHVRTGIDALRRRVELGVYILPPSFVETGQDAARFSAFVDFLSPMAYYKDWGFEPSWVTRELIPDTVSRAGHASILPVIDQDWTDEAARSVLPALRHMAPRVDTLVWFAYGKWTAAALERMARLTSL
jgi:hypothetical protein